MRKKLIVEIAEGLGNKMFMYANAYALAKSLNYELLIDNTSAYTRQKNLLRKSVPITVTFNPPLHFAKDCDVELGESQLREVLLASINKVQEEYPDSHQGQRWAPVRLGGTAPAPLNL
mgnify:CR=1 FL=1